MPRKKRVKKNKQRSVLKRRIVGKKPMSKEQKEVQKKRREADKVLNEATNKKNQPKKI
ncbi:hypothetical protein J4481_01455 [Candidatus Pacearchaeota archaeon]|nr:hypothetical protein [Candidatus Pacearchaeota archaeon]